MRLEARIFIDAVAWTIVAAGALAMAVAVGLSGDSLIGHGYLLSVMGRSLGDTYQFALLSGLIAAPFHAIWGFTRRHGVDFAAAYDRYGIWAQTLFTSLGFLGTIIGVSLAVGGLEAAMTDDDPGALIAGLSTAFDTTFIGLTASVLILAIRKCAQLISPASA